jgi:hypothetical protein
MKSSLPTLVISALLLAVSASASIIDFEDQPVGPSVFASAGPAQTLVYTFGTLTATFTGGVILTNETAQTTDNSNVYATCSVCSGDLSLTNPLIVTFSAPVQNFQIDILNALQGDYTIADNNGHFLTFNLATTGGSLATEGFAASGNVVTITYDTAPTAWDFAIDNVLFNQPLTSTTPEPASLITLGSGLVLLLAVGFKKRLQN